MVLNKSYVKNKESVLIPNLEEGATETSQVIEWKTALRRSLSNLQPNSSF